MTITVPRPARYVWHRHRPAVFGVAGLFVVAAIVLVAEGVAQRIYLSDRHTMVCLGQLTGPPYPRQCSGLWWTFPFSGRQVRYMTLALLALPPAAALFAGLPWVTREFETGTFRFTWAQSVSPRGWLTGTFAQFAVLAAVAAAACGAAAGWWLRVAGYGGTLYPGDPWRWEAFELSPLSMASWALLAMALALLVGVTVRRTVAAMAVFLVGYGAILWLAEVHLRPLLLSAGAAVTSSLPLRPNAGLIRWWYDYAVGDWYTGPGGHPVSIDSMWRAIPRNVLFAGKSNDWLAQHHYRYWLAYQPHHRLIWFQLAWAGILLAAAALCVAAAIWWLRKHPAE